MDCKDVIDKLKEFFEELLEYDLYNGRRWDEY